VKGVGAGKAIEKVMPFGNGARLAVMAEGMRLRLFVVPAIESNFILAAMVTAGRQFTKLP
jgi:hypothetical protein